MKQRSGWLSRLENLLLRLLEPSLKQRRAFEQLFEVLQGAQR
jgi:hypothetical protein